MEKLEKEKYIHNEHDKLFKRILDRTEESLIKKLLGIKETKKIEIQTVRLERKIKEEGGICAMIDTMRALR